MGGGVCKSIVAGRRCVPAHNRECAGHAGRSALHVILARWRAAVDSSWTTLRACAGLRPQRTAVAGLFRKRIRRQEEHARGASAGSLSPRVGTVPAGGDARIPTARPHHAAGSDYSGEDLSRRARVPGRWRGQNAHAPTKVIQNTHGHVLVRLPRACDVQVDMCMGVPAE